MAEMDNPADMLMGLQQSLNQLAEGLQGSQMPKEAQAHLVNAASEFDAFMQSSGLMGGGEQMAMPPEAAGREGAVPEGTPMKRGAMPA